MIVYESKRRELQRPSTASALRPSFGHREMKFTCPKAVAAFGLVYGSFWGESGHSGHFSKRGKRELGSAGASILFHQFAQGSCARRRHLSDIHRGSPSA